MSFNRNAAITIFACLASICCSPFASAACDKICQNSLAVFQTPTKYEMFIVGLKGNQSAVYVTWTSKTNLVLAPVKFSGVIHTSLRSTTLKGVNIQTDSDVCEATVELIERGKKGKKSYRTDVRNVLCESANGVADNKHST